MLHGGRRIQEIERKRFGKQAQRQAAGPDRGGARGAKWPLLELSLERFFEKNRSTEN